MTQCFTWFYLSQVRKSSSVVKSSPSVDEKCSCQLRIQVTRWHFMDSHYDV